MLNLEWNLEWDLGLGWDFWDGNGIWNWNGNGIWDLGWDGMGFNMGSKYTPPPNILPNKCYSPYYYIKFFFKFQLLYVNL
ncbi:hypothetical protein C1645_820596 [Glomus cerebriforme]|uniref:Uncharacterized protein n=1 Tax=Glomus cerebriforme TaxID=658196 RepID=A0A397T2M8_9GLOM|nr:hypothetical protein C1645_820596 [Glomus cerebriforme]